jgi:hypothetical protein
MTANEAARMLGPMAALWPNLNDTRRESVWQGLNAAERQAVALLFGLDACFELPPELPQDPVKPIAETDYPTPASFSKHRQRWQGIAEAGQAEVRRNPQNRVESFVEQLVAENVNPNRQRWQRATDTGHLAVKSKTLTAIHNARDNTPQLNRARCGFWCQMQTVLVCLCMTPIPYIFIAWLLWLACSS